MKMFISILLFIVLILLFNFLFFYKCTCKNCRKNNKF